MRGWSPARSATRSGADERVGRRSRSGRSTASTTSARQRRVAEAVQSTSACSRSPRGRSTSTAARSRSVGRRRQGAADELAAEQAGAVRCPASVGPGSRKMPPSPIGAAAAARSARPSIAEQAGGDVRQVGGEGEQLALGLGDGRRGPRRRGSRTARRRAPAAGRRASAGRSVRCAAAPRRRAARRAATRRSPARSRAIVSRGRLVEPERVDVGRRDGEVGGREPGHLAGRPQPGDAQRRRPPAGQHEVQPRREVQHERLEELAPADRRRRRRRRR